MPIDSKRIHPSVFAACDKLTQQAWSSGGALTPSQTRARAEHSQVWFRQNGKSLAFYGVALLLGLLGVVAIKGVLGKPYTGIALLAYLAVVFASTFALYQKSKRQMTAEELKALAPALDLTPTQLAYTDAVLALNTLSLPKETEDELWSQLNLLLDEEARLLAVRDQGVVSVSTPESIAAEMAKIEHKLSLSTDPSSREALQRSLEICEKRLRASRDLSLVVQRVDAQLEMIGQSMADMRDTLQRLGTAPSESSLAIDLEPLRLTLEHAHRHTAALEQAVTEVQALR